MQPLHTQIEAWQALLVSVQMQAVHFVVHCGTFFRGAAGSLQ
jgi:hypothetical protein